MKRRWVVKTVGSEEHVFLETEPEDTGEIIIRMDAADVDELQRKKNEELDLNRILLSDTWKSVALGALGAVVVFAYFFVLSKPVVFPLALFFASAMAPVALVSSLWYIFRTRPLNRKMKRVIAEQKVILAPYGDYDPGKVKVIWEDGSYGSQYSHKYLALPKE
ncbi:MAG TPA: hypothetical protein VGP13_04430 [Candidatus Paceibacterota bacterium]|jgi:hypothetical protein|nr:hypothetical protein [Candidatus Paceibacterota bacterium]